MRKINNLVKIGALCAVLFAVGCKKKNTTEEEDNNNNTTTTEKSYVLVIDNGAQSMDQGQSLAFSAHLVSKTGEVKTPGSVTWSSNIGTMVGGAFTCNTETVGTISASCTQDGVTYNASVPISVQPLRSTRIFGVVPSAIIWSTNSGDIQLNPVYIGMSSASYAYSSDNANIASVSASGLVKFNAVGNTNIKVTGTIDGKASTIVVPVMVVGVPEVPLPVTRVVVTPVLGEMFRNETLQLTAKAYNSAGAEVTGLNFTYAVLKKEEEDDAGMPVPVTVNQSGLVTANALGGAYVKVTAQGVSGQAEIVVNPDTAIFVSPFNVTLGTDYSDPFNPKTVTSATLTAKTYKVDRTKYRSDKMNAFTLIANPANLQWVLPETGIAEIDNLFKVVTLKSKTNSSCVVEAIQGKVGSTIVIADAGSVGGAASVLVNP